MLKAIIRYPNWWQRKSKHVKIIIALLIIIFIFLTLVLVLITIILMQAFDHVCITPGCVLAATGLIKTIDRTVNPCDDFYEFTCGKFQQNILISKGSRQSNYLKYLMYKQLKSSIEETIKENEPRPFKIVKQFYKACMNITQIKNQGIKPLKDILQQIGDWPLFLGDKWNETNFVWWKSIQKLRNLGLPSNYFLSFIIRQHPKHSNERIIQIGFENWSNLQNTDLRLFLAFTGAMINTTVMLGADGAIAAKELEQAQNFCLSYRKIVPTNIVYNLTLLYNPMSIFTLQEKYYFVNWMEYFKNLLHPYKNVTEKYIVNIVNPEFILELQDLIIKTPKRVLANYLLFRVISDLDKYTYNFNTFKVYQERYEICLSEITARLPILISSFYIHKHFNEETKKDVDKIAIDIQNELVRNLIKSDWLDENTKTNAIEKARALKQYIGYPEELKNLSLIDNYCNELEVNSSDYIDSVRHANSFNNGINIKLLDKSFAETNWMNTKNLIESNAYNMGITTLVPVSYMQGHQYSSDRPNYLNFATIGSIIAHELMHGFDGNGIQIDKNNQLLDWMKPASQITFLEKVRCMIDKYGNYTIPELSSQNITVHLDGDASQNENIADNGGMKLTYNAYQNWIKIHENEPKLPGLQEYTQNQLFWIAFGNTWCEKTIPATLENKLDTIHPPDKYRLLGILKNIKEFSKDFFCEPGSNMNPEKQCSIW